jgi:hypothetical protein
MGSGKWQGKTTALFFGQCKREEKSGKKGKRRGGFKSKFVNKISKNI